jgi:adenosylhomocysteine nucleosidase
MKQRRLTAAVVCATSAEYEHCKTHLQPQIEQKLKGRMVSVWSDKRITVALVHAGPGKIQCASATQLVIDEFEPSLILDIGAAGSLDEANEIGCVICGQYCFEYDICPLEQFSMLAPDLTTDTLAVNAAHEVRAILNEFAHYIETSGLVPSLRMGNLVSGEQNVVDVAVREQLRNAFDALACNWETAAVLKTASLNNIDRLSFRVITDKADANMTDDYKQNLDGALEKLGCLLKTFLCDGWSYKVCVAKAQVQ